MIKRNMKITAIMCVLLMVLNITTILAAEEIELAGLYTNEQELSVYVKGIEGEIVSAECQIGTKDGQEIKWEDTKTMEQSAKTLIMLDNSLSITETNREKIYEFLMEFVDDKPEEELVSIVTFDEDITVINDYVSERKELEAAIESLTYQNQETYLTDALYEVLEQEYLGEEDCYKRIIIISDGVDNKYIGYTKDELYELVEKKNYPVYTIGCMSGENNEELKNMFALSRMTMAKEFVIDEVEDIDDMVDIMTEDNKIDHITIVPDSELLDGMEKAVLMKFFTKDGEYTLKAVVDMPFGKEIPTTEQATEIETETTTETETEVIVEASKQQMSITSVWYVVAVILGVLLVAVLVIVFVFKKKKTTNAANDFEVLPESHDTVIDQMEKTVYMNESSDDSSSTQLLWGNQMKHYTIVLTDTQNSRRVFQKKLTGEVIVGRDINKSDLVIDYEKSVSGKHCKIREKDGKLYIQDLQSSNGTLINGMKIMTETEVYSGCIITLGRLEMKFEIR